jgi:hypothetical protein
MEYKKITYVISFSLALSSAMHASNKTDGLDQSSRSALNNAYVAITNKIREIVDSTTSVAQNKTKQILQFINNHKLEAAMIIVALGTIAIAYNHNTILHQLPDSAQSFIDNHIYGFTTSAEEGKYTTKAINDYIRVSESISKVFSSEDAHKIADNCKAFGQKRLDESHAIMSELNPGKDIPRFTDVPPLYEAVNNQEQYWHFKHDINILNNEKNSAINNNDMAQLKSIQNKVNSEYYKEICDKLILSQKEASWVDDGKIFAKNLTDEFLTGSGLCASQYNALQADFLLKKGTH